MGQSMRWAEGFIAADWGTTNRRAYLIGGDGSCIDEFEDGSGILSVEPAGFPAAVGEIRQRLGERPLLLAGMVGSNRGWTEAPYVPCPASIDDLAQALVWPEANCAIVPGVSLVDGDRADVMRGEEVQILGAAVSGLIPEDCLVCHPGTHNKWIEVRGRRIESFRTVMTGELFNLLKEHSILSDLLSRPAGGGAAFDKGVRRGLESADLQAELFAVRARVLLDRAERDDAASFTSGLLIGGDVRIGFAGTRRGSDEVIVMARPELTGLYARAIRDAGGTPTELDGEECFLAGIREIARRIS